jgi:hypothetical protein
MRWHDRGSVVEVLDGGSHTAAVVTRESLTADEMSGLNPTYSVFGDFLEIFFKWYVATFPIAVGYLTRRHPAQPLSFRVAWLRFSMAANDCRRLHAT